MAAGLRERGARQIGARPVAPLDLPRRRSTARAGAAPRRPTVTNSRPPRDRQDRPSCADAPAPRYALAPIGLRPPLPAADRRARPRLRCVTEARCEEPYSTGPALRPQPGTAKGC